MPVQTKFTSNAIAVCMIIFAAICFSSCSVSNSLMSSQQHPHYKLDLTKEIKHAPVATDKTIARSNDDIAPMAQHGSLVSYNSSEQLKQLNTLLTGVKQLEKQLKKADPVIYKSLKVLKIDRLAGKMASPKIKNSKNTAYSVNNINDQNYDLMKDPKSLAVIWLLLLGASIVLLLLASSINIFYFIGGVVAVAFFVFFILWILSAAKVPDRVS